MRRSSRKPWRLYAGAWLAVAALALTAGPAAPQVPLSYPVAELPGPRIVRPPICPQPIHRILDASHPNVFRGDFTPGELAQAVELGDPRPDRHYLHTFAWPAGAGCTVTKAVLTVHMQANQDSSGAGNDAIAVVYQGAVVPPYSAGIYPSTPFPAGQTATTTWDLQGAALANLNAGHRLSVYVEDDTRVLAATLDLTACCPAGAAGAPGCDDEAAAVDLDGNVIFPPELDTSEPVSYEDVDQSLGNVTDLYPGATPGLDTWYPSFPCNPSIGGTVPPEAASPDLAGELAAAGISAPPEEIAATLGQLQSAIAAQAVQEPERLSSAPRLVAGGYTPPAAAHCPLPGGRYVFGGRDIVFVHGLRMDPLFDKIFDTNPDARTTWPQDRAAFYDNGYWKQGAERYWADHIQRYLTSRGIMNRFLIVAYPSTQRLEVGAQAVLAQIADAMMTGKGVVDPSGRHDNDFGTPSFVVVSHSTGGLLTDVAMRAAAAYPNLGVGFIPRFAKGQVALNAVFSGSRLATAAVALSGYLAVHPTAGWLCPLANLGVIGLNAMGSENPTLTCPPNYAAVATSILVDLVPLVTQLKWGPYVRDTPLRTLTVVGAHPSYLAPLKRLLLLGEDDGVSDVESQVGNPGSALLWPSGFDLPHDGGWVQAFDMGVFRTDPLRAVGYFRDQLLDRFLNPASLVHPRLSAAGPTPYVSATGMLQPVGGTYPLGGGFDPFARYPNHFSFLYGAADHFGGSTGPFNGAYYRDTFGEHNLEETRVVTDVALSQPFAMVYPGDDAPLVAPGQMPPLEEVLRGRRVHFKIKILGHKIEKSWWIWRRRYHLLRGWQQKTDMDYVYESVLTQGAPCQHVACTLDEGLLQVGNTYARRATLAETFRPAQSGTLTQVSHSLWHGSTSVSAYNLYVTTTDGNGRPSWPGGVLAWADGLHAFASSGVDAAVPIANGPHLSSASTYALVLEPSGPGDMYWHGNSGAGSYPNGAAYQWSGSAWQATTVGPKDHGFHLEGICP